MRAEIIVADEVAPDEGVRLVNAADTDGRRTGGSELDRGQSPTDRWSDRAVVESMSISPSVSAEVLPAFIWRVTVRTSARPAPR